MGNGHRGDQPLYPAETTRAALTTMARIRSSVIIAAAEAQGYECAPKHHPWRNKIIKIMVLLHSAAGLGWQSPPKGTSLKTLAEAEEQGFILIRGEFQKRQFRLTEKGSDHVERDRRRLEARRL